MNDDYEHVLLVKPDVFIYKISPRTSVSRAHRVADWKLDQPDWKGRLRLVLKGKKCVLKLEDKENFKLFAECFVEQFPGSDVESVSDSSRYFVIKIKDSNSGRTEFIGIGFEDRSDSFDLNVALQDHFKRATQELDQANNKDKEDNTTKIDLSLKEDQTIKVNLNIGKKANTSTSTPKSKSNSNSIGLLLPTPPPNSTTAQQTNIIKEQTSFDQQLDNILSFDSPNKSTVIPSLENSPDKLIDNQIDSQIINKATDKLIDNQMNDSIINNKTDKSIDNQKDSSTINSSNQIMDTLKIDYSIVKNETKLIDDKFNLLFNDLINKAKINSSKINSLNVNNENSNCSADNTDSLILSSIESIDIFSPSLKKFKTDNDQLFSEDGEISSSPEKRNDIKFKDLLIKSKDQLIKSKDQLIKSKDQLIKFEDQINKLKSSNNQNMNDEELGGTIEEFNQLKSMLKDITSKGKEGCGKSSNNQNMNDEELGGTIEEFNQLKSMLKDITTKGKGGCGKKKSRSRRARKLLIESNRNNHNFESFFNSSYKHDLYLNNYSNFLSNDYNLYNNQQINTNNVMLSDTKLSDSKTFDELRKENKPIQLINWFNEQTKFFEENYIKRDENKLNHTILHLDVRWFTDLEEVSLNNNKNINYDLIKENLVNRCKLYTNAMNNSHRLTIRSRYEKKVNNYINKISSRFDNQLNLQVFLDWLKDLRRITDGSARDDILTELILDKVKNENKKIIFSYLLKQIKFRIDRHNFEFQKLEDRVLNRFKLIREKITRLLINLNNEQFNNKYEC